MGQAANPSLTFFFLSSVVRLSLCSSLPLWILYRLRSAFIADLHPTMRPWFFCIWAVYSLLRLCCKALRMIRDRQGHLLREENS